MAETWLRRLLDSLRQEYETRFMRSGRAQAKALQYLIDGGSHPQRLFDPFPFRVTQARGATVHDLDGHELVDYWQGHYANILGHNPPEVNAPLAQSLAAGYGLQTGLPDDLGTDLAEVLLKQTGDDRVRFTTAGSLATMYAIMLARAFTGRMLVLKVGGGWHGSQPLALRGTHFGSQGFLGLDSRGVPQTAASETLVTRYNDPEDLLAVFRQYGDQLACFIMEPYLGSGGFMPARPEYLGLARQLTQASGALLILDEIISGFRFCAGGVQKLYGVRADLSTYGKVIGGGMPVSAVTGRADVMDLASKKNPRRVLFNGGTFSAQPASMLAGKLMLQHLADHEATIYPRIGALGAELRNGVEQTLARHGILARCTGRGNAVIPASSLGQVIFPFDAEACLDHPEVACDPHFNDVELREGILKLGLLLQGVSVMHGLGAVSTAHSPNHIARTLVAFDWVAGRIDEARRQA